MKKTIMAAILFIIVFIVVLVLKFPYAEYMEKAVKDLNSGNDIKITWKNSENKYLKLELKNVTVNSKQGEILKLDDFIITAQIFGGFKFRGKGVENLSVSGNIKNGKIKFSIEEYPLPSYIASMTGDGKFKFIGDYDIKKKSGKIDFNGVIKKIPNPIITEPAAIAGEAEINGNETSVDFEAKGKTIAGAGKVNIKGSQIAGNIKIDTGIIPVNVKISGELNNIKIKL